MKRKGLSQILYLIIAASILMMVALSLIFAFQTGLGDAGDQADTQACISSAQAQCENLGSSSVVAPSSCYFQEAGDYQEGTGLPFNVWDDEDTSDPTLDDSPFYLDCNEVL